MRNGKFTFAPILDIDHDEYREFCAPAEYELHSTFIIGPPRDTD